jgi:hypothetical protein
VSFRFIIVFCGLLAATVQTGWGQYRETKYPFRGVIKFDDGSSFQVGEITVPFDNAPYVKDLRLIGKGSSGNTLSMPSVTKIDFVAMAPDEGKVACSGGAEGPIYPCMYRKADVQLRDGTALKGIYLWARFTVHTPDGDSIELDNPKFKVFSITRDQSDSGGKKAPAKK